MSHHIQGRSRSQATFFPEVLDDFVSTKNPVRVIDVFVDELDLSELGFLGVVPKDTGRPNYHPAMLLKLYLYGYLNHIQSSRRLEREANRNIELMWLTERLAPDFKTIADFRKNNSKGIKRSCRTFIGLCRQLNMFSDAIVAIDGSKFKASNNKSNNYTPKKVQTEIDRVEKHISRYLTELDKSDDKEKETDTSPIEDKLTWLKTRLAELNLLKDKVDEHPDKQISTIDPDSRLMQTSGMQTKVCYNLQSAVDCKHHLIVAHEVTNTTDRNQLCRMGKQAQDATGINEITVLADKGYFSSQDIVDAQDAGMTPLVPGIDTSGSEKKGILNKSLFKYDVEKDQYICPAKQELKPRGTFTDKGLLYRNYSCSVKICRVCPMKEECNKSPVPRKIRRWERADRIEMMTAQLKARTDSMLIRKSTVEHPFGTIKFWMGSTHLLTRGFKGVSTEMNLHVLAYNLKRMISIFGVSGLIKELMTKSL
ncbi:MAG: transposase [Oleiphilaceae bacterium]|jgi:transposase